MSIKHWVLNIKRMTLQIFLYAYFAFLVVWGLLSISAVYHALKYSLVSFISVAVTVTFIASSALVLLGTASVASEIDWDRPLGVTIETDLFKN